MHLERYELKTEKSGLLFEFVSIGPKGPIQKLVWFDEIEPEVIYNLSFGDKDPISRSIDDTSVSNNGDSKKILATVVSAIYAFTDKYPDAWIYAIGSTKARNRLYRIGITKYLKEAQKEFDIYGIRNNSLHLFEKDTEYDAFLAKRKK